MKGDTVQESCAASSVVSRPKPTLTLTLAPTLILALTLTLILPPTLILALTPHPVSPYPHRPVVVEGDGSCKSPPAAACNLSLE